MALARKTMGDYMLEKGYISPQELENAKKTQQNTNGELVKILVDMGLNPVHVYEARAAETGKPFVDLSVFKPEATAINVVPIHIAKRYSSIPIKKEGNVLYVAMKNPDDIQAVDSIRLVSRCTIRGVLAVPDHIEDCINRLYGAGVAVEPTAPVAPSGGGRGGLNPFRQGGGAPSPASSGGDIVDADAKSVMAQVMAEYGAKGDAAKDDDDDSLAKQVEDAPIVRLANTIIQQAVKEKASDIHLEPDKRGMRVRYRIDGVLHETMTMPNYIKAPLTARYKIMSEMNIAERRVPQDGRIGITYENKPYDLRVSCLPNLFGEKIVMRILDKSSVMIGLNKLGFTPEVQDQLIELAQQPNGMLLSTGPTGSGKTTTQYSLLNLLNNIEKNILTVEDPCEYQLGGITQVQVNNKAGLTFAKALRSFLRQDPDIIMVGEMRDLETAGIGVEAALTGHLVLSTLHTNDAPSATLRLIDMGVDAFLVAATVVGIMAQRLGRRICSNCKEYYEEDSMNLRRFGFKDAEEGKTIQLARGKGCEICRYTGYKGRVGFYELLRNTTQIQEMIVRRASLPDLRAAAKAGGMHELREDGLIKVLDGMTTPDEVMRVVFTAGYDQ
jgi:type IV pilus assembly protein PilB